MMNAQKQLQKYERLAEFAHKAGLYNCARKWSIKAEKLEAVINALETIKEVKQVVLVKLEGSEKQIKWAEKIRENKLDAIQEIAEKDPSMSEKVSQAIKWLGDNKANSKWWIENRDNPSYAFFAYAIFYGFSCYKVEYKSYQCSKINGEVKEEKLVNTGVSVLDLTKFKKPVAVIDSLKIESTYNEDETITYKLSKNEETFLKTESSRIQPLNRLLPGGWAGSELDCVIVRTFLNWGTGDYRIGGDNIKCYVFVKIKEFAQVG